MATFLTRIFGLLLLTLAIGVPSCQAVFAGGPAEHPAQHFSEIGGPSPR